MRLRAGRFFFFAFLALLPSATRATEAAATRAARPVLVPFRGVALGRDMNLREATTSPPPASPLARTTPPATPSVPRPLSVPSAIPAIRSASPISALPPGASELALQPTTFTPYDRYLGTVRTVMGNLETHDATMTSAARLMRQGHRFKYCICDPYRAAPPTLTEARHAGDCKSKALWLYDHLGDSDALFVIGKAEKRARKSHAWVYWRNDERWWILDCTEHTEPLAADSVSSDRYVPYYSFGKASSYRHKATRLLLTGVLQPSAKPVAGLR